MQTLESVLGEHYCFKGLEKRYLDMIVNKAYNAEFKEGEFILHEGDKSEKLYIIQEGIVALETRLAPDRDPITIQMIGEGDVLGWAWLFPPYLCHFDAKVVAPTKAVILDGNFIRTKCDEDHDLGYELLKRFAYIIQQRLQAVRLQNPNMYVVKPKQ
ncbi:MAG TPA: cyclic nucleotide-binding domain-containing protein [Thermodesulfobacteriota bacterium]|nr:cyclic nucleotide-binding domain-containing protein [Thermodesulfobacteriota bacterium]